MAEKKDSSEEVKENAFSVDHLFQDDEKRLDDSIDRLFEEDRKGVRSDLLDDVEKALSQPEMSKASLFRMRMKEPSATALSEEIAKLKTPEEIWEEPLDESTQSVNRKSIIVMSVFIVLIVVACGWALWQSTNHQRGNEKLIALLNKSEASEENEKQLLKEELSAVSEVVGQYLSAITVSQKNKCIYQDESLRSEMEAYYNDSNRLKPMSNYSIKHIFPVILDSEKMWEVFIRDQDTPSKKLRSCYVRKTPEGEYKVDWKADVAFQDNDIKEFIEKRSKTAKDFKFIVEPMTELPTYNWGFTDKEYEVLRLTLPNSEKVLWGYVKKNSLEKDKLTQYIITDRKNWLLSSGTGRHEFILKIKFLEDSPEENDQYVFIEDVVSRKWIYADK